MSSHVALRPATVQRPGNRLKRAALALTLVVLVCLAPRLRRFTLPTFPADFYVYYCAADLVRQGETAQLYNGADTGADPQKAIAAPGSPIFKIAQAHGLSFIGLYVYPPLLADLLVPLTTLTLPTATHAWLAFNCLLLLGTALISARLLGWRLRSRATALLLLVAFCFTPALQCLVDGQITIAMLFLWAIGLLLYQQDHEGTSGAAFALATAIKITPALVLLPLVFWRKGRFLAGYAVSLLLLTALCAWVNTPRTLLSFATRVLPAMSGATPAYANFALPASTQRLITLLHTGSVSVSPGTLPPGVVLTGRVASALALLALVFLLARLRSLRSRQAQVLVLGLLSLLAPVLSPVSWFHAYTTAYLALALLWHDAVSRPKGNGYLLALTAVSLCFGTAVSENLIQKLLVSGHDGLSTLLHSGQLLLALGVIFYQLWRLRTVDAAPQGGSA